MKILLFFFVSLGFFSAFAQTQFPLGDGVGQWGVPLKVPESILSLRLGARFQSLATMEKTNNSDTNVESTSQDFHARRVRFQLAGDLGTKASFYMDVRNDNADRKDEGEQTFNIGDAYVNIPFSENSSHHLRLYRTKVDVARTQTVSSAEMLFVNRAYVADEAAQFVSHNRRASNIQVMGDFNKLVSYQLVAGDGVFSGKFNDAKGNTPNKIVKQNFMVGGKFRLHPFKGWDEIRPTETYFGKGHHFTVGAGAFNTSNIQFLNGTDKGTVSRTLYNAEISAHYGEWSMASEYFKMDGVIEDFEATSFDKGSSEGWYVQGEKLFSEFHFLAPFVRFEKWNRFIQKGEYESYSNLYGVNWYLNGNRFRVALAYEKNQLGRDIADGKTQSEAFHLTSMWHF